MKKKGKGFLLALPAVMGFAVFYFAPFLITIWYSVSFGIGKRVFVGIENYKELIICKTYFHPYLTRCGTYYLQTSGVEVTYS